MYLITTISASASKTYLENLNRLICDLNVKNELIINPKTIVNAAAIMMEIFSPKLVVSKISARTTLLKTTVMVPVIKYFPKVCLCW